MRNSKFEIRNSKFESKNLHAIRLPYIRESVFVVVGVYSLLSSLLLLDTMSIPLVTMSIPLVTMSTAHGHFGFPWTSMHYSRMTPILAFIITYFNLKVSIVPFQNTALSAAHLCALYTKKQRLF